MAGSTTIKFAPSDLTALASASGSATVAARTPSTREARQVATEASTVSKIATPEGISTARLMFSMLSNSIAMENKTS